MHQLFMARSGYKSNLIHTAVVTRKYSNSGVSKETAEVDLYAALCIRIETWIEGEL